jgi:hypothetical protein
MLREIQIAIRPLPICPTSNIHNPFFIDIAFISTSYMSTTILVETTLHSAPLPFVSSFLSPPISLTLDARCVPWIVSYSTFLMDRMVP